MLKLKSIILSCFAGLSLFTMVSCKNEITLTAQPDGSALVSFSGECGKYFENMIRSVSDADSDLLFDGPEIQRNFMANSFTNVKVRVPGKASLESDFSASQSTYLFTSGLLFCDKSNVFVNLTPEILVKFYESADEDIVSILDLLIAPVFNDEEMTVEEYLDTVGSFYGNDASDEIGSCNIKLTLIDTKGQKKEASLPLTKLLCLQERIKYSSF